MYTVVGYLQLNYDTVAATSAAAWLRGNDYDSKKGNGG